MQKLRQNGISIYVDAVLNHKAGADDLELFKASLTRPNSFVLCLLTTSFLIGPSSRLKQPFHVQIRPI